ncbi:restriction endonuclease subunit S [Spirosoma panaciterrae]|uniref:restriction endonuclease subunit S n=1 Tax=Spirosoma panaciterrae TaxID=496058 RepID=UPI000367D5F5|nr:restriction endonuclease subunit S [Spirosoma panaciterrae]
MERVKLNQICTFISGNAWKSNDFSEQGIPIIRINNLDLHANDFVYWNLDYDKKYIINKGDILLSLSGTIKIYKWHGNSALLNQRIVKIEPKAGVNIDWIYYKIAHSIEEIINKAKSATIKNVSVSDIKDFEVNLPDFETQNKIVAILDKSKAILYKRIETILKYDELLRSTFWKMFGEYEGKDVINLSDIADVTSGITKGKDYSNKTTVYAPYMRVANVQDGYLDLSEIKEIEATEEEIARYNLQVDDLLLTEGGDPDKLGRGSLWKNEIEDCIFQNHIFRVRIKDKEKLNPVFLSYQTSSAYGKSYFLKSAKQTTGIASINSTQLKKFPVYLPPEVLQIKFAKIALKIESIKKSLEVNLNYIRNLNINIAQLAFAGELTFNTAVDLEVLLENDYEFFKQNSSETAIQLLIDRLDKNELNDKRLYDTVIYDKAKNFVFELLKEGKVQQVFDELTKSVNLVVA